MRARCLLVAVALFGCSGEEDERCGPSSGIVARVVDGDTVELESGEKIRYLMIDTPESTTEIECYGEEAKEFNASLVEGKEVQLEYDVECKDRFDRTLAYVTVDDREVNSLLVERGFACVLYIPPNGEGRMDDFESLEAVAEAENRGLWGACEENPCN
ncbi:MAG TPA: thermonuclease family protein [Kofleriaceae bacterium]|nr:thermonuclease family protein [Kofleriaceae bacterium]